MNRHSALRALVAIARGRRLTDRGNSRPMGREEMQLLARDACDSLGWPYDGVEPSLNPPPAADHGAFIRKVV